MAQSIRRGFVNLLRFSGRDSRGQFWPYAFVVFILAHIGLYLAMMPMFLGMQRYALQHPERATVAAGPGHYSIRIEGEAPELSAAVGPMASMMGLVAVVIIFLLAAAVTRRLHDRDQRGWWGLLPLPFLAAGLLFMPRAMNSAAAPEPGLFLALFVNNLVYLSLFIVLIVKLAKGGTAGPNRFGPAQPSVGQA